MWEPPSAVIEQASALPQKRRGTMVAPVRIFGAESSADRETVTLLAVDGKTHGRGNSIKAGEA